MLLNLLLITTAFALAGPNCGEACGAWDSSSSHYVKGDCVEYSGRKYCAKWWTAGTPGTDSAWEVKIVTTTRPPRSTGTVTTLPPTGNAAIDALIAKLREVNDDGIFMFEKPDLSWERSTVYHWNEMITAVQMMADKGIGTIKFFPGDDAASFKYGMVNVAAFLSQAMQETIRYNACDENNWSDSKVAAKYGGSVYPASSACGQLGQSYQDYKCFGPGEEDMACEVDPDMEIRAVTRAQWYGAPPELFCAPRSKTGPTPQWDVAGSWCAPNTYGDYISPYAPLDEYIEYMNNGGTCQDVENQKDGKWTTCAGGCANLPAPSTSTPARTDVEGCCWWGRGVIQTTGTCNFGKLNYYLGERAHKRGVDALYPEINFCKDPEVICRDDGPSELKWISGLFFWMESVQSWDDGDFVYMEKLKQWVDGGMDLSDTSLVDAASGITNRGCPKSVCAAGEVHAIDERRANFEKVMKAMEKVFDTALPSTSTTRSTTSSTTTSTPSSTTTRSTTSSTPTSSPSSTTTSTPSSTTTSTSSSTSTTSTSASSTSTSSTTKMPECPSGEFVSTNGLVTDEQCTVFCKEDLVDCLEGGQCRCSSGKREESGVAGFSLFALLLVAILY